MKPLKVLIVVPSGGTWIADFAMSLVNLVAYFAAVPVPGYSSHELRVANIKGSILPKSRLQGLKAAKETGSTHLLFVDSDHTFPADLLHRLLAREKSVIAANCVTKSIPAMTTARLKSADSQGIPVYSDPESVGMQRVWRIGTGIMLLEKRAFDRIPHSAFGMPYKEELDTYQGEDWTLCEALDNLGIPIYIDHGVSKTVGHVGTLNYTHDYVGTVMQQEVPNAA